MYGLPEDVDLTFLIGVSLIQVCIGENEVILNFDGDVSAMVAGSMRCKTAPDEPSELFEDSRAAGTRITAFLGDLVVGVMTQRDGTVRLTFNQGGEVEFLDSWSEYESYTIRHGQDLLVV